MTEQNESTKSEAAADVEASEVDSLVRHFGNLDFTVVATPHSHRVEYVIYDHEGQDMEGNFLFTRKGATSHPDPVVKIEDAEPYLHGHVKWDGCSNWYFDEQDRVMLHGCTKEDVLRYGLVMAECWEWTKELCPSWLD